MPAKTPMYLKTTTPKRGKKPKLRDVLSGDMISPPLGDVRHSAHVGPQGEGDMFGDVGFLQGKMDMLPALNRPQGHARSHSMERHLDEAYTGANGQHHPYGGHRNTHHHASSTLKTTISMPMFLAHEQAPPKPPRLHLDDPAPGTHPQAPAPQQNNHTHHNNGHTHSHAHSHHHHIQQQLQQQPRSMSVCDEGQGRYVDPRHELSYSASFRHLVPSSGSFSEASSEDSMSETCGPLDPRRGLSLDSDAGLSNEDLRSERSESPAVTGVSPGRLSPGVSRSESLAGLDLDLGPSILDDVLRIMDRYKTVDDCCEL
ncbi:cdc42 effector protein 3 [Osmerus eperlanus]|uniref:cdc42 effector protein 3 n=1 Tax=Osmerus eperlanus TaxID=29151 RepID=UPI002E12CECA